MSKQNIARTVQRWITLALVALVGASEAWALARARWARA
ncbi:MAG: hypothetical protein RLZZ182_2679 [Pseudomonadota bacterium]|jgi:hypothetical protein